MSNTGLGQQERQTCEHTTDEINLGRTHPYTEAGNTDIDINNQKMKWKCFQNWMLKNFN